jgi:hypothetical protein
MEIEVLVPVPPLAVIERPLAPRLDGLAGRRIGFLDNQKANAGLLLDHVADGLQRVSGPFDAIREQKVATMGAPADVMGRLQRCHAVVLAIAD